MPGVPAEAIAPAAGHGLWRPASRAAGRSGFSENRLHEPKPIFWASRANVGIQNWANVPFGATRAGEVTLCQLFQCPPEDRPSDCFILSLPLSGPAERSNLLRSTMALGHNGKCFSVLGFIMWLDLCI